MSSVTLSIKISVMNLHKTLPRALACGCSFGTEYGTGTRCDEYMRLGLELDAANQIVTQTLADWSPNDRKLAQGLYDQAEKDFYVHLDAKEIEYTGQANI